MPWWLYSSISSCRPRSRAGWRAASRRRGCPSQREDELRGAPGGHHLVVDQVRRQPRQGQVAPPLADHLVAGREADQVGEALDRQRVAVVDVGGHRLAQRDDLGGHAGDASRRSRAIPLTGVAAAPIASREEANRGVHRRLVHDQRRAEADRRLAALQDSSPRSKAAPARPRWRPGGWRTRPRASGPRRGCHGRRRARSRPARCPPRSRAPMRAAFSISPPRSGPWSPCRPRRRSGCRRRSSRGRRPARS